MGLFEEYLSYFPEDLPLFQPYIDAYNKMEVDIAETWNTVAHIENQKEFALAIQNSPVKHILFQIKKGMNILVVFMYAA